MKAIDFALMLLTRISQDDLTAAQRLAVVGIGAGLTVPEDIAKWTGASTASVNNTLHRLAAAANPLVAMDPRSTFWSLTPEGHQYLKKILA